MWSSAVEVCTYMFIRLFKSFDWDGVYQHFLMHPTSHHLRRMVHHWQDREITQHGSAHVSSSRIRYSRCISISTLYRAVHENAELHLNLLCIGGHTAEMLALLKHFPLEKYSSRAFVVAATDKMSAQKAQRSERSHQSTPSRLDQVINPLMLFSKEKKTQLHMHASQKLNIYAWQATESRHAIIHTIPRSREVGQSYLTSIGTTVVAIVAAFRIVLHAKPDLVSI
jgi:hypothetical protein